MIKSILASVRVRMGDVAISWRLFIHLSGKGNRKQTSLLLYTPGKMLVYLSGAASLYSRLHADHGRVGPAYRFFQSKACFFFWLHNYHQVEHRRCSTAVSSIRLGNVLNNPKCVHELQQLMRKSFLRDCLIGLVNLKTIKDSEPEKFAHSL